MVSGALSALGPETKERVGEEKSEMGGGFINQMKPYGVTIEVPLPYKNLDLSLL